MGTLSFMPWTTVYEPVKVGAFTLRPVILDKSGAYECNPAAAWVDPPADVLDILKVYRNRPNMRADSDPSTGIISSATVIQFGERPVTDDLSDEDIENLFSFREAFTFSGLAEREFFAHNGYCNKDSFTMIGQRFSAAAKGVSLVSRRLDGTTTAYWPLEYVEFRKDAHIPELRSYHTDGGLAGLLLDRMTDDEPLALAVAHFNSANTDRSNENAASDLIWLVSAYQQLLGSNGKCDDLRSKLAELMLCVPVCEGRPARASLLGWLQRQKRQPSAREAWILDLCTSRGNVAHGHRPSAFKTAVWSLQEHLLLGSYLFPLLVKLKLCKDGARSLRDNERRDLALFDVMCTSENLMGSVDKMRGVPSAYRWNEVRRTALFRVDTNWSCG
ncbi:hypothetical protein [Myxococcus qinghaiensis]|uniref:hypothetical protein n=1 Tax=Myxococcus qinghaiensis TaxID=2906758 RepID=UPI0020A74185|nr:hypothetical protein [Myxococcus qinghaiensis]MCP3169942.1 hypothetical protein [Myxococcus qinghaiensis]